VRQLGQASWADYVVALPATTILTGRRAGGKGIWCRSGRILCPPGRGCAVGPLVTGPGNVDEAQDAGLEDAVLVAGRACYRERCGKIRIPAAARGAGECLQLGGGLLVRAHSSACPVTRERGLHPAVHGGEAARAKTRQAEPGHRRTDGWCCYCRAIAIRISLSVSLMRSPDKSTVTLCRVPVNRNGDW